MRSDYITHDAHLDDIVRAPMSQREKLRLIDEQILDVLYDDQLRHVAFAMSEPEPSYKRPSHKAAAFALNCFAIFFGGYLLYQMFRP